MRTCQVNSTNSWLSFALQSVLTSELPGTGKAATTSLPPTPWSDWLFWRTLLILRGLPPTRTVALPNHAKVVLFIHLTYLSHFLQGAAQPSPWGICEAGSVLYTILLRSAASSTAGHQACWTPCCSQLRIWFWSHPVPSNIGPLSATMRLLDSSLCSQIPGYCGKVWAQAGAQKDELTSSVHSVWTCHSNKWH